VEALATPGFVVMLFSPNRFTRGILHWQVGHYWDSLGLSVCRNTTNVERCGTDTYTVVIAIITTAIKHIKCHVGLLSGIQANSGFSLSRNRMTEEGREQPLKGKDRQNKRRDTL